MNMINEQKEPIDKLYLSTCTEINKLTEQKSFSNNETFSKNRDNYTTLLVTLILNRKIYEKEYTNIVPINIGIDTDDIPESIVNHYDFSGLDNEEYINKLKSCNITEEEITRVMLKILLTKINEHDKQDTNYQLRFSPTQTISSKWIKLCIEECTKNATNMPNNLPLTLSIILCKDIESLDFANITLHKEIVKVIISYYEGNIESIIYSPEKTENNQKIQFIKAEEFPFLLSEQLCESGASLKDWFHTKRFGKFKTLLIPIYKYWYKSNLFIGILYTILILLIVYFIFIKKKKKL